MEISTDWRSRAWVDGIVYIVTPVPSAAFNHVLVKNIGTLDTKKTPVDSLSRTHTLHTQHLQNGYINFILYVQNIRYSVRFRMKIVDFQLLQRCSPFGDWLFITWLLPTFSNEGLQNKYTFPTFIEPRQIYNIWKCRKKWQAVIWLIFECIYLHLLWFASIHFRHERCMVALNSNQLTYNKEHWGK